MSGKNGRYCPALGVLLCALHFDALAVDFVVGWELEVGGGSDCVALVDIDGDSDLDAYVCYQDGPDRLWLNDGFGTFSLSPQVLDASLGAAAEFGLFNGDSYPDLFLVRNNNDNRVWFNDVNGMLTDTMQSFGVSLNKSSVALGFLNADSNLDAFVPTNTTTAGNKVYFGNASGVFADSLQDLGDSPSTSVALADVGEDMNGDIDAIVGNNGANKVWYNDGTGVFSDSGEDLGVDDEDTFGLAVGLLNGDAVLDVFVANGSNEGLPNRVMFGDGDGTFTDSLQSLGNEYSFSVALHDFDNQNGPDAFVGNNTGIMDRLWVNDGTGAFSDSGETLGVGGAIDVKAGLINNDAHLDVFVANILQPDQVWLGDGAGNFSDSGQLLGSSAGWSVALADFDGDTDLDAAVGNFGGIVRIFVNDGAGNFTDSGQWLVNDSGNNNADLAIADFDGMNGPDIFVANSPRSAGGDRANRIWLNDGSGVFTDSGQLLGMANSASVAVGNVDGDGDLDVLVGNAPYFALTGDNVLYLNNAGTMTDSGQSFGTGTSTAIALVDVDGDTDLDAVIGNFGAGNRVYLNGEGGDPLGTFSDTLQDLGANDTQALAFGLLNNDLHIDMVEGNDGSNKIWFGDGAGNFADSGQSLGTPIFNTREVHLFDADEDGDLDIWVTNGTSAGQGSKVWLNDGSGMFSDSGLSLGDSNHQRSAMGLLDGDDLPDVFVVSSDGDHRVWINDSELEQIITPDPLAQDALVSDPVSIDVNYAPSDANESLSGIGLRMHWDSSELTFVNLTSVYVTDLVSTDASCQADGADFDGDPMTDCYVGAAWNDVGDDWPGTGNTPTQLYTANFTSNVPIGQTAHINFSASALAPGYALDATSASVTNPAPEFDSIPPADTELPFGEVPVLTTSLAMVVQALNVGTANLTLSCAISGPDAAEFDYGACPTPVAPDDNSFITVFCEPTSAGLKNASLDVTTNDADEPLVSFPLTCTGTGGDPEFDSDPSANTTLPFGDVPVLSKSAAMMVEVDNLGTDDLTLSCALSGSDAGEYDVTACSTPVAPAGSTQISVVCEPTSVGLKNASLDVTTNDSDEPLVSYPLTCTGTGSPEFDATPVPSTNLNYGDVQISTVSDPQVIEVENLGNLNLLLNCNIVGPAADQFMLSECPSPVEPAVTVELSITCEPTSTGLKQGQLNVQTNDSDESEVSWMLNCTGVDEVELMIENGFEDP